MFFVVFVAEFVNSIRRRIVHFSISSTKYHVSIRNASNLITSSRLFVKIHELSRNELISLPINVAYLNQGAARLRSERGTIKRHREADA